MTNSLSITGGMLQPDTKYKDFLDNVVSTFHAKYPNRDPHPSNKVNIRTHVAWRVMSIKPSKPSAHFEWVVWTGNPAKIEVGLHFENPVKAYNLQMLNNLMQHQQQAQENLGSSVVFSPSFPGSTKATRIYLMCDYTSYNDQITIDWAVRTMNSFMIFFTNLI